MKRFFSFILSFILIIVGCSQNMLCNSAYAGAEENDSALLVMNDPEFSGLSDPSLIPYVEDTVYTNLISVFYEDDYVIENVEALYISQEYLDEAAYNSKTNVFFGYSLEELDEQFEGTRYVFTFGDDNETVVIPFEKYSDDTYGKILRNVAIGAGVILICVTVSSLTVTAAPAVSMIFAMAAETGAAYARSGAVIGFISSAVIHYLETGDLEESFKEGLLAGSEGFKVGAIVGSIEGAAFEISFLHKWHKKTNISWNDAARIQRESKYSLDFLQSVHSMEEYNVYKEAGLREYYVDGQHVLLPKDFDFDYVDPRTGMTNRDLMRKGNNPVSADGIYDWHHVGQKKDSPLALLTKSQHQKNYSILHPNRTKSEVRPGGDDSDWEKAKRIINRLLADWFL